MPTTILDNESYLEALQRRYAEETKAEKQLEITRIANEACSPNQILNTDLVFLERFFNLAFEAGAAHEREQCAKVCEGIGWGNNPYVNPKAGTTCAAAIRARNNQ